MPARIAALPLDPRGFPVPWFAAWIDGQPHIRVVDNRKVALAVTRNLCFVCGDKLGRHKCFVIGPMCAMTRTTSEPPAHRDCAIFAARNCPFLANPLAKRPKHGLPAGHGDPPGSFLERNPGCCAVWITGGFSRFRVDNGVLISIGDPEAVLWFCEGRPARRAEIMASIESGLPILEADCRANGTWSQEAMENSLRDVKALIDAADLAA